MTISARTIELAHRVPIENIIRQHGIQLRGRIEKEGACPRCAGTDRFSVNIRKNVFNCRGCNASGDVITLVQFLDHCSFQEAIAKLINEKPSSAVFKPPQNQSNNEPDASDYERRQLEKARWLWRSSQAPTGTPVEAYLRRRLNDSTKPLPLTVRYLRPLKSDHYPAMIVPFGVRKIMAVQLTLLKPDGSDKADVETSKLTIASPAGMPIVIAPPNDLLGLAITEGVEDALSVHCATGLGAWASGGASNLPKLAATVPSYIEAVTIYSHADQTGQDNAHKLADALSDRGISIRLVGDFQC